MQREKPILMSAPMVRAILDGRKTMTRRTVKIVARRKEPQHLKGGTFIDGLWVPCPYGQPGDRLWVRETHGFEWDADAVPGEPPSRIIYRADPDQAGKIGWAPSIHMPRWASRITLEITAVRVEKLGEISEEDAIAEGVFKKVGHMEGCGDVVETTRGGELVYMNPAQARVEFRYLWEKINGSWTPETWVWVIEFRRVL